ncbi:hypothetical protein S225a_15360 [Candidatus Brocadiaceae bacterium S225]|uniref:Uncharacterized protein n=1 Tax=Candidatus Scalindua brodae TaxID=237368 RepID=A0A0B0EN78_9BACT|nr:MAG: hypothetical protein SCABRO_00141 [Candidatus Scalindua brodae]TWU33086.1 hypothetical protein S225a_15360 [Candidatus Brocadiaceae bacterium S225]
MRSGSLMNMQNIGDAEKHGYEVNKSCFHQNLSVLQFNKNNHSRCAK